MTDGMAAEPVDVDTYVREQGEAFNRGWTDSSLWAHGLGPYTDGSWRSSHPGFTVEPDIREWRVGRSYGVHVYATEVGDIPGGDCDEPICSMLGDPNFARPIARQLVVEHNAATDDARRERILQLLVEDAEEMGLYESAAHPLDPRPDTEDTR